MKRDQVHNGCLATQRSAEPLRLVGGRALQLLAMSELALSPAADSRKVRTFVLPLEQRRDRSCVTAVELPRWDGRYRDSAVRSARTVWYFHELRPMQPPRAQDLAASLFPALLPDGCAEPNEPGIVSIVRYGRPKATSQGSQPNPRSQSEALDGSVLQFAVVAR